MKISFGITVHNEGTYLQKLLPVIFDNAKYDYEIVILDDFSTDEHTIQVIESAVKAGQGVVKAYQHALNNNFAAQKNALTEKCSGDYIFQIDADERPTEFLAEYLHTILDGNQHIDLFWVPRVNTVEGLTQEHIDKWRWNVNDKGWVNWPDYQSRIYRKSDEIQWKYAVHEVIEGHKHFDKFPMEERFAIIHEKEIARQEQQNAMYSQIARV